MGKRALKVLIELHLDGLFLIVLEALLSLPVEALLTVKQVRRLVPYVAQPLNVKAQLRRFCLLSPLHRLCWLCSGGAAILLSRLRRLCWLCSGGAAASYHHNAPAVLHGVANLGKANALFLHEVFELLLMLVAHLDDNAGVLGKQRLHDVAVLADVVQVDVHTALGIGKAHLQQRRD